MDEPSRDLLGLCVRRRALVVASATVLALLALIPASRLHLVADLTGMLPTGSNAAEDYRVFLERFGGFEKVFVLVMPAAGPAGDIEESLLVAAAQALTERLAASPEVATARCGVSVEDEEFVARWVAPRAPLLLGASWAEVVERRTRPEAIRSRVADIRAALLSPTGMVTRPWLAADPLGFTEDLGALGFGGASLPVDPMTGSFVAPDGSAALVVLSPARSEIDPAGGHALEAELQTAFADVQAESTLPLELRALGGPLYAAHDERVLRHDLSRTVTGSALACTALLVAAFGGAALPAAALATLAMALAWTAGIIGLGLGQVSAIGIGFAAVLIGLGVDYGIHGGTRFRDHLLDGLPVMGSLRATVHHTGPGILTSALTTAAAFVVLGAAHFRPLRELGLVVALGVFLILLATAAVGPALLALLYRSPARRRGGPLWRAMGRVVETSVHQAVRRPRTVLAGAVALTVAGLAGLGSLQLDPDLRNFRPADHPTTVTEELLVRLFDLGLDTATVVVHGRDLGAALAAGRRAEGVLDDAVGGGIEITSPTSWLVAGAPLEERLRDLASSRLGSAAAELETELRAAGLNPAGFATGLEALRALGRGSDPGAPPEQEWPDWLDEMVRTGPNGAWIALRLRLPAGSWPDGPPEDLLARIRTAAPGAAVASATRLGRDIRRLAGADARRLGGWALLVVAAVVLVSFRGAPGSSAMAALPVLLGSTWVLGLWSWLGLGIDLFSLAVLPIILGIGIDDGLHAVHGARLEPDAGVAGAVRGAGRAMVLTTLTTCAGFGSLLLSHIPAMQRGGLLVAAGVLACLVATLLVLPAVEALKQRRLAPNDSDRDSTPDR